MLAPSNYPGGVGNANWKEAFKGVPYIAIIPIGEQTQEAGEQLLDFLVSRKSFSINESGDFEDFKDFEDYKDFKDIHKRNKDQNQDSDISTDESW
jgi:hypothetical protein